MALTTNGSGKADAAAPPAEARLRPPAERPAGDPRALHLSPKDVSLERLLRLSPEGSRDLIRQAYDFADRLHTGQKRQSGEPYIQHPLIVASYLAELHLDGQTIAAGLLHDVLEDTQITDEQFAVSFPEQVVQLVKGVTKISRMSFATNREAQVENLRLMILAMARDVRVVVVKLCDRLHNMQTLKPLAPHKRLAISQETLDIYAPLANRMGMSAIKSELEDLAMRWLFPTEYKKLAEHVAKKREERERLVLEAVDFLYDRLSPLVAGLEITGRPKHFYSIFRKMKRHGLTFEQIYDLNALRVICNSNEECYDILGHIHSIWSPIPGRFKDYIGMPKKNQYQSIHTTVIGLRGERTEIQIRTREMHEIAELGIAAHWHYKEKGPEVLEDERFVWLRQLTEWITDPNEPEGFLDALKEDVFADRVLCFTPKGRVVELPAGGTPIDFAFNIHTQVGETCTGAKINGRMVNLRSAIQHGDVVEIITSPTGHPSRDWLKHVKTGRAKQKIKHWLKTRNLEDWIDTGRRAVTDKLRERGLHVPQAELDTELKKLLPAYKLSSLEDLYVEIGFGSISPHAALVRARADWGVKPRRPPVQRQGAPAPRKRPNDAIVVEGVEGAPTKVANCCRPIPGDPIVGYVTRGRGITIHRRDCSNIQRLARDAEESQRLLSARWNQENADSFIVTIRIEAEDRAGLLNAVTGIITGNGLFIVGSATKSDASRGVASLNFELQVQDTKQLDRVLDSLRNEPGVITAERRRSLPTT